MRFVHGANVGHHALGDVLARRFIGIGGEVVEDGQRRIIGGVVQKVGVDLEAPRPKDAAQHDDEGAVGLGHLGHRGRRNEFRWQVGWRGALEYQAKFDARRLQSFDGGSEFGVQVPQRVVRVLVGVSHGGDLRE
jgi:hypothetical protein